MDDITSMTLGEVVDFCISFNERQKQANQSSGSQGEKKKQKPAKKYRLATQEEINAYFG